MDRGDRRLPDARNDLLVGAVETYCRFIVRIEPAFIELEAALELIPKLEVTTWR